MKKLNNALLLTGFLFLAMFFYGISNLAIGTLITRIIEHYSINMAQAGLLSSFISAGNFLAILVFSVLSGRLSKMILTGASVFFYGASLFFVSIIPPFGILLADFSLMGIFMSVMDMTSNSLTADLGPDRVDRNMSYLHGIFGLGGLCGPVVLERLAHLMSWAEVYRVLGTAYFVYFIVYSMFIMRQWNSLSQGLNTGKSERIGFGEIIGYFRLKRNLLLFFALFFYGGNQSIMAVWIKRYVETYLNVPAWGAYSLSAMWLGIAISRLFISPAIRCPPPLKICIGNLITALTLTAGLLCGFAPGIAAAALLTGLSSGLTLPLVMALSCEWYPEKTAFGTMMAFMAFYTSFVVFPPLSGFLSDLFGIPWGVSAAVFCALMASLFSGRLSRNQA